MGEQYSTEVSPVRRRKESLAQRLLPTRRIAHPYAVADRLADGAIQPLARTQRLLDGLAHEAASWRARLEYSSAEVRCCTSASMLLKASITRPNSSSVVSLRPQ